MNTSQNLIDRADELTTGAELKKAPQTLLLLRLCQFYQNFNPEKAQEFWQKLQDRKNELPANNRTDFDTLKESLSEEAEATKKGFAQEMIAKIEEALNLEDPEKIKTELAAIEKKTQKRFNPFGKRPIWNKLIEVWYPLDKGNAFALLKKTNDSGRIAFLNQWNKAAPLTADEWDQLLEKIGNGKTSEILNSLLDNKDQKVKLNDGLLYTVARYITDLALNPVNNTPEQEIVDQLLKQQRLMALHTTPEYKSMLQRIIKETVNSIAKNTRFDQNWVSRFNLISIVFQAAHAIDKEDLSLLEEGFIETVAQSVPKHLTLFIWACWAGITAEKGQVKEKYDLLMKRTRNDRNCEFLFFASVFKREILEETYDLAAQSPNANEILKRLRRAWVCLFPQSAGKKIKPEDMQGDAVGEFLAHTTTKARADYLKKVTDNGTRSLPGGMWAGVGTDKEGEGIRSFWDKLLGESKTLDEILTEYLALNPLYSSFSKLTKKEDQFADYLRINTYKEYKYQDIDNALLSTILEWQKEDPQAVHTLLGHMWDAMRPNDTLLRVDFLRNALFTRCLTVFGADKEVLFDAFLTWFDEELIKKGRQWTVGKTTYTLRFPHPSLMNFTMVSASNLLPFSADKKDDLLITGVKKYILGGKASAPNLDQLSKVASLYNNGKQVFDLAIPVDLNEQMTSSWQIGIVNNAVPELLKAIIQETLLS